MVLGVHWLKQLGPIVWDFIALSMQFTVQGQRFTLQGLVSSKVQMATKKQIAKWSTREKGLCTLLMTITGTMDNLHQAIEKQALSKELQGLL